MHAQKEALNAVSNFRLLLEVPLQCLRSLALKELTVLMEKEGGEEERTSVFPCNLLQ